MSELNLSGRVLKFKALGHPKQNLKKIFKNTNREQTNMRKSFSVNYTQKDHTRIT